MCVSFGALFCGRFVVSRVAFCELCDLLVPYCDIFVTQSAPCCDLVATFGFPYSYQFVYLLFVRGSRRFGYALWGFLRCLSSGRCAATYV